MWRRLGGKRSQRRIRGRHAVLERFRSSEAEAITAGVRDGEPAGCHDHGHVPLVCFGYRVAYSVGNQSVFTDYGAIKIKENRLALIESAASSEELAP